jgi:hypothetical protein
MCLDQRLSSERMRDSLCPAVRPLQPLAQLAKRET